MNYSINPDLAKAMDVAIPYCTGGQPHLGIAEAFTIGRESQRAVCADLLAAAEEMLPFAERMRDRIDDPETDREFRLRLDKWRAAIARAHTEVQ